MQTWYAEKLDVQGGKVSKPGFTYHMAQDDGLALEFIRDFSNDILNADRSVREPDESWYGVCLDEEVGSTVAVVYGKDAAEALLALYQASMMDEEEYEVEE